MDGDTNTSQKADRLVYDVPEAGALLGLSRNGSYEAAARGEIPTIKVGRLLKVPKAAFHKMLGIEGKAVA
jgi:excisionase family DNA binding protein